MVIYNKPIPIYFGRLVVIVNNDFNESFKKYHLSFEDSYDDCMGLSYHIESKNGIQQFFIFLNDHPTHSTIAHESLHITHYILDHACHKPDYNNDEPECYLHDYIVGEIYKFLEKHNIKVKC